MKPEKLPSQNEEIEQARADELRRVEKLAPSKTSVFRKAFEGKSLRKAITAHCLQCSDYRTSWVRECRIYGCPLWNVRPYQTVTSEKADPKEGEAKVQHDDGLL